MKLIVFGVLLAIAAASQASAQTLLSSIVQAPLTFSGGHVMLPTGGGLSSSVVSGNDPRLVALGTAPPTTGANTVGTRIRNSTPTELGTTGSKYIIDGWVCVTAGTPGTWVPIKALDGN